MDERRHLSEKVLPVKPFNDIWYKNCLHNAIMPMIQYYLGRIDSYIVIDLGTVYSLENVDGVPSITSSAIEDIDPLKWMEKLGIQCKQKERTDQLLSDIKRAIYFNRMVIVCIDCYYEKERSDTYHVNHWPHAILVHGFSDENFYIIESRYKDSVIYENSVINCSELVECYEGYLRNFGDTIQATYCEFFYQEDIAGKQSMDEKLSNIVRDCLEKMMQKKQMMEESVESIALFSDKLTFSNDDAYYQKLAIVIENMNGLINNLKVNQYLMEKLFSEDRILTDLFNETIRLWNGVRSCLAKIYYAKSCSEALMDGIKKKLNTLYELEKKRISLMDSAIKQSALDK